MSTTNAVRSTGRSVVVRPTSRADAGGDAGIGGPVSPALDRAIRTQRAPLLAYARCMVGDAGDAAALTDRTVAHAQARSHRLAEGGDLHAWLYQIAYHLALESGRHHDDEVSLGGIERLWRDEAYRVDVTVVERQALRGRALQDAVLRLPVHYRNVVVLHDALGWSAERIGAMLGVAPAVARDRLRRARMMLVSALDGSTGDAEAPGRTLSCSEARAWVSRLIDDELGIEERGELAVHLAACPACTSLHRALGAVRGALDRAGRDQIGARHLT